MNQAKKVAIANKKGLKVKTHKTYFGVNLIKLFIQKDQIPQTQDFYES